MLLIGDSIAFGSGVPYEMSFARLLEANLTKGSSTSVAVWNAGVPGYNTGQEAAMLEKVGKLIRPQLVIVEFCLNDYLEPPRLTAGGTLDATSSDQPSGFSLRSLLFRSRALVFVKEKFKEIEQYRPEWFPVWAHYIHYVQERPGWQRAKEALARIGATSKRLNAHLLVVIFPVEQQLRIGDRAAQNDLIRFTQAHDIETLDLYDSFRARWREGLYVDYWPQVKIVDKLHPNKRGHDLAARQISDRILARSDFYLGSSRTGNAARSE